MSPCEVEHCYAGILHGKELFRAHWLHHSGTAARYVRCYVGTAQRGT